MMIENFRAPESVDDLYHMFRLFLEDAFGGQVILNDGETDDSLQVDILKLPGVRLRTFFLTFEDSETYFKRLHPEEWEKKERKKANGQPVASPEPEEDEDDDDEDDDEDDDDDNPIKFKVGVN